MRHDSACAVFVLFFFLIGGMGRCAGSDQQRLIVRDGKKLICSVFFASSLSGDCGTQSYDAVFVARILAVEQTHGKAHRDSEYIQGAHYADDLRLTVDPKEVFKGHSPREMKITAEQGECFPEFHVGDEWLFFANEGAKTKELEISYYSSNPSGPIEQRGDYIERLRRLGRGDGLSYVTGEGISSPTTYPKGTFPTPGRITGC